MSKVLIFDIETSTNLAHVWGAYQQDVLHFERQWFTLCFAYKWLGQKKIHIHSLPDYPLYKKDKYDDKELVKKLWSLFDEADVIMAHNGDRFDIKKMNARFIYHGLPPPSTYRTIDTLKTARKVFGLNSNRLDDIAAYLQIGRKLPNTGKHLWLGCMNGDMKAWKKMCQYNKHDVWLLAEVYEKIKAWEPSHPNLAILDGKDGACPTCKSKKIVKWGYIATNARMYQRHRCNNCGRYIRGNLIKPEWQKKQF